MRVDRGSVLTGNYINVEIEVDNKVQPVIEKIKHIRIDKVLIDRTFGNL